MQDRETLGQQIYDNQIKYAGQKTQTIRETTDEMGKKYMEELLSCAKSNLAKHNKDFYILEIIEADPILDSVMKVHFQARWTRPNPEWGLSLYKVEADTGELRYLWGLPRQHEAYIMMQNPDGWEGKTIQDIQDFITGMLL
jgi:hypothetical protein